MKPTIAELAKTVKIPVFQAVIHRPGASAKASAPAAKLQKPNSKFSKSRDTREDRGTRQMKTGQKAQTLPHAR